MRRHFFLICVLLAAAFSAAAASVETPYMFLLNSYTGDYEIYLVGTERGFATEELVFRSVDEGRWLGDWAQSLVRFYQVGWNTYLFRLGKDGRYAAMRINRMNQDGTVGPLILNETTPEYFWEWQFVEFFMMGSYTYMFRMTPLTGLWEIYQMKPDGTIGPRVWQQRWKETSQWKTATTARIYTEPMSERTFLFLLTEQTGLMHIYMMYGSGAADDHPSVGRMWQSATWTPGWTTVEFYRESDRMYMFAHKRSDLTWHIHAVESNGTIGALLMHSGSPKSSRAEIDCSGPQMMFHTTPKGTFMQIVCGRVPPHLSHLDWQHSLAGLCYEHLKAGLPYGAGVCSTAYRDWREATDAQAFTIRGGASTGATSKPLVQSPADLYAAVGFAEIKAAKLSADMIDGSDTPSNRIPAGTILLYQTSEGRYGKLLVSAYGYNLTLSWTTYNSDGSVYTSGTGLVIRGTFGCDLDRGVEVVGTATDDFQWRQVSAVQRFVEPKNGARFTLYSRP